jgi:hypothetical protein
MRARLIIVESIRGRNLPQVCFAEDEHLIQALAAQSANQLRLARNYMFFSDAKARR